MLELDHDPGERRAAAEVITDEIDRMDRIVSDILLLSRAEQPDFLQFEPVALRELVATVQRKVTALGPRDWRVELPGDVVVPAASVLGSQVGGPGSGCTAPAPG